MPCRRTAALACGVGLFFGAAIVLPVAPARAFDDGGFVAPITGASDFVTGFPQVTTNSGRLGPLGMLDDGLNFFVSDPVDGRLYRFPLSGGDVSDASVLVRTGTVLTGLAEVNGRYVGTSRLTVQTFNPYTLQVAPTKIALPCTGEGIAHDPSTSDLFVATGCGVFRVEDPLSLSPTVTKFSSISGFFDGIAVSSDGLEIWVADATRMQAVELDRSGAVVQAIDDPHGPDGISLVAANVRSNATDVSDNVFVNNNDGTVLRIDTGNGNAASLVATGGSRGDFSTVGHDGCLYVTQSDRIEKLAPCLFEPSNPITSRRCPALTEPIVLSTQAGDASATVSWTPTQYAPPFGCVAGYVVTPYIAGVAQASNLIPGPGTTTVVKGLTNGQAYSFTVASEDGQFVGPESTPIGPIAIGAPTAANNVRVTHAGRYSLRITFKAPRDNGAPIARYVARCTSIDGGVARTTNGTKSPLTVTELNAGRTYRCSVAAANSRGRGQPSRDSAAIKT